VCKIFNNKLKLSNRSIFYKISQSAFMTYTQQSHPTFLNMSLSCYGLYF